MLSKEIFVRYGEILNLSTVGKLLQLIIYIAKSAQFMVKHA